LCLSSALGVPFSTSFLEFHPNAVDVGDSVGVTVRGAVGNREMSRDRGGTYTSMYDERRGTAWFGDCGTPEWSYGNLVKPLVPHPFPSDVDRLRRVVNSKLSSGYDSCLVNFYESEDVGMKWHADPDQTGNSDRPLFTCDTCVVSAGRPANLKFRPVTGEGERFEIFCCHGDLVRMKGDCQVVYEHAVEGTGERFSFVFKETLSSKETIPT